MSDYQRKIGEYRFYTGFRVEVYTQKPSSRPNGDDCGFMMFFGPFGGFVGKLRLRPPDIRGFSEFIDSITDKMEDAWVEAINENR